MVFSSPVFLFAFLPLILLAYFALRREFKNGVLLGASLFFYAWGEQEIVVVMLASILANYGFGLWVEQGRGSHSGRWAVGLSVVFNLGLLIAFKYANWIWSCLVSALGMIGVQAASLPVLEPIPLPIGISFFTFQAMSYVIDVYREEGEVQRNPFNFAVYIALFPQLIAGPIVRYRDVAKQIVHRVESWALFTSGVRRFTLGLGKKMLIANVVALPADQIFAIPVEQLPIQVAWLGILCYSLQIYFDFSGYSDMAIGLGRMFGFTFLENFNYPYISRSITDFWRRWHMSLSSWFRDYLYIPLGGNRKGRARTLLHLLAVFLLCGLWHGAAWNFIAWGVFHGGFLVFERVGKDQGLRFPRVLQHGYTLVIVMIGWVLFRAATLDGAVSFIGTMFGLVDSGDPIFYLGVYLTPAVKVALIAGLIGAMPWMPRLAKRVQAMPASGPRFAFQVLGVAGLALILLTSAMELSAGTYNPFIYFRF